MKTTIENQWNNYVNHCFPDLDKNSDQYETMKTVFYSAWFDSLVTLKEVIGSAAISEEKGVSILETLLKEAMNYIESN